MLTRAQKNELLSLGTKLGNPNIYNRLSKERIQSGFREVTEQAQVRTKSGTVLNVETAIEKGLIPAIDKEGNPTLQTRIVQKPIYSPLNFEQMKNMLENAVELKILRDMPASAQVLFVAYKFNDLSLKNIPHLVVEEKNKTEYEQLLALVPEDRKEEIGKLVVPRGNPQLFCMDAAQFLQELIFVVNHTSDATDMFKAYLSGDFSGVALLAEPTLSEKVNE